MTRVLANGCFDPIHYGHMLHLAAARALGTELIVSLSSDRAVVAQKGHGRLFLPAARRAEALMMLRSVTRVEVVDSLDEALARFLPDVLAKGEDYAESGLEPRHAEFCRKHGIRVAFTRTPKWSALSIADEIRRRTRL